MATRWVSGVVPDDEIDPSAAEGEVTRATDRDDADEKGFFNWRRAIEWALIPLAFIVMRFVPDRPLELEGWLLLVFAGALFASPAVLASHREHQKSKAVRTAEELAVEYRLRLGLTLGEAVVPIGDLLGRIVLASADERPELQGQLRQRVVDAAAALVGAEQPRAIFFGVEDRTLRTDAWAGRPDPPAMALPRAEIGQERAYELMEARDRVLVAQLDDETDGHPFGGQYETYLGVAVYAGDKNFGILCVDAQEPGDLTDSDVDIVAALAQMLGPGLAAT